MILNKDTLKVNNINLGNYILEAEFGYNKLWADDSGRNLSGSMSGTFLGVFPKIRVTFRKLTQQELEYIAPVLDSAKQNFTYYDPVLKRSYTMETYTGDWLTSNKNIFTNVAKANESFDISFISIRKRG